MRTSVIGIAFWLVVIVVILIITFRGCKPDTDTRRKWGDLSDVERENAETAHELYTYIHGDD